ncbi:MAG: HDOD domain-containing protein, partial [Desulfobacteraceae bacterium]|nr:HDOD domain-containing protein [Desulfobacteraceae bacterium]
MKILIIDDDFISRKILNAKLNKLGECTSVDGGKEAISLYNKSLKEKEPFNLLVLDISMPHVNGLEVLKTIRGKERKQKIPKTKRVKIIMVTSRMNKLTIKSCIKNGCNGYITKPVNSFLLFQNIKKLGFEIPEALLEKKTKSHKNTVEEIIKRFYKGEINLPVLPNIIQEVQDFLKSEDASIDGLVKIVEKDPVMTGKLISIANSPLYKGVDAVDNLNSGLVRLGLKVAQSTISTIANKNLFNSKNKSLKELLGKLWMHSFACACCGKLIAEELEFKDSETIFLMGIVHD